MRFIQVLVALFILASCSSEEQKSEDLISVFCDAETVEGEYFLAGKHRLKGAEQRSDEKARSGKFSVKLNKDNPYGLSYQLFNIKKGEIVHASVWKHKDSEEGGLVVSAKNGNHEQYKYAQVVSDTQDDWQFISYDFIAQKNYDTVIVYAYQPEINHAYFDDMTVKAYMNTRMPEGNYENLEINISTQAFDSLSNYRDQALEQGVISEDLKKNIRASISISGENVPIDLRLKGDWTDHLESDKWSFRIKVKGDHSYKGLKSFSIQNPSTRGFMNEWFAHKVFEKENVLTTRYIFIPVKINGKQMGVYALEEHFDKQLLESRKRREGPIVKFDESGVWEEHLYGVKHHKQRKLPLLEASNILPFKKNRTRKSPTLSKQFEFAQYQMNRYKHRNPEVDDYFDVDALAKWIALTDVLNGKHGTIWHNQRHYFNPVTNKLEPIAYDCYTELHEIDRQANITGLERKAHQRFDLLQSTLGNEKVEQEYYQYLIKFSEKQYLEKALAELENEILEIENLLGFEYPFAKLDKQFFMNNSVQIRVALEEYEEYRKNPNQEKKTPVVYPELEDQLIFEKSALKVHLESMATDSSVVLSLTNFHSSGVTIIGYSTISNTGVEVDMKPIHLGAYNGENEYRELKFASKPRRLYYKADNCGERVFKAKIGKFARPKRLAIIQKNTNWMVPKKGSKEVVFEGEIEFNSDVYIEDGLTVVFKPGTKMNLKNNAAFISHSPIQFQGIKDKEIQIYSSDGSANGFVVLSKKKSSLNHVIFKNLNTMNKYNWILTGAVTFYGSEVSINNCQFLDNHCEDGLNLIRCKFTMLNSIVSNTYSDGFDADFCSGVVKNCFFSNTGNDCIDFSGSEVEIRNCKIQDSGDKGISGGEDSELEIVNCFIDRAYIGIASKDFSRVKVSDCSISNSKFAFAVYRKKPEYGPASIEVVSMKSMKADQLHLLEKGSKLNYLNREYVGVKKFDIDAMYEAYKK